jgi:triosephosphate isomerase (TIM)
MMARIPVIAGNWKLFKTQKEAADTITALRGEVDNVEGVEVVVCPTYTSLAASAVALDGSTIGLGAQNVHYEEQGAFTGELSTGMLIDAGCSHVIIGHSERRQYFNETDEFIGKKLAKILTTELTPILCCGETLEEREAGKVDTIILGQLKNAMAGLTEESLSRIIIAYEPIWAIGTGKTATPEMAEEVHAMIRKWLAEAYSECLSDSIRILYGGSVKPGNISELMSQADIDGALVGGASLDAQTFAQIVKF